LALALTEAFPAVKGQHDKQSLCSVGVTPVPRGWSGIRSALDEDRSVSRAWPPGSAQAAVGAPRCSRHRPSACTLLWSAV